MPALPSADDAADRRQLAGRAGRSPRAAAANVPPELETALAPDGRMRLADLLEEELLLALPAAPRHPEDNVRGSARSRSRRDSAEPTQRPFADLGELLKSGSIEE